MRYLNIKFVRNNQNFNVYVIAVNKSREFLLNVRRLSYIFFRRRRKGFDFDDESMFSQRRRTLVLEQTNRARPSNSRVFCTALTASPYHRNSVSQHERLPINSHWSRRRVKKINQLICEHTMTVGNWRVT